MANAISHDSPEPVITAKKVATQRRASVVARNFGLFCVKVETYFFAHLDALSEGYQGGYWEYYELSNGGLYAAPIGQQPLTLRVSGNGYSGQLSHDAAGIVACLMTYSHLSFERSSMGSHFHWLRDYAKTHPEHEAIFAAID